MNINNNYFDTNNESPKNFDMNSNNIFSSSPIEDPTIKEYTIDPNSIDEVCNYIEYVQSEYIGIEWKPCYLSEDALDFISNCIDDKLHPKDAAISMYQNGL